MVGEGSLDTAAHAVSSILYFAELDDRALQSIARAALRRHSRPDQTVFVEREPCTGLYVVESRWLMAVRMAMVGREQVLRFVGPGEVVNEVGVLADTHNPATVIAREPTTAWLTRRQAILRLLQEDAVFATSIVQSLARPAFHLVSLVE